MQSKLNTNEFDMLKTTKEKMIKYAQSIMPSTERAMCYQISNLHLDGKTIAEAILGSHASLCGALRASELMVLAECAKEVNETHLEFGKFIFEDGSEL